LPIIVDDSSLSKLLSKEYHYPTWIVSRFLSIIPDTPNLLHVLESPPRKYIRINTLKTSTEETVRRLMNLGFEFGESILPEVFEIRKESYSVGSTLEYLLGHYYIQDLSSCLAVIELNVSETDIVLDMTCAPGGKTTFIAQNMNNRGILIAIDSSARRIRSTFFNLMRCGIQNTHIYKMDAVNVPGLGIKFDRVLLDAPCSCEGVISRDKSIKINNNPLLIDRCAGKQIALLNSAIKVTKPGGLVVYSTCTYAPEENEFVINTLLNSCRNIEIEAVKFGVDGLTSFSNHKLDSSLKLTKRLYPHLHGTLGFYIAKLRVKY
jgi:NOL1/NOP2/sun family putative RNA methylase